MARKPDISAYRTFDQITGRLDDIITQVRNKDTSLERSLDLFDEAIALGSKAVDLVDTTDFSPAEEALLADDSSESGRGGEESAGASVKPAPDGPAS